jgi:sulfonate dioxygenase
MAPSLEEPTISVPLVSNGVKYVSNKPSHLRYEPGRTVVDLHESYLYNDLCPSFPDIKFEALTEKPYTDKGNAGDSEFRNLLAAATDIFDYTPKIGTEVSGVQLTQLTDAQKNDLARLIAVRGVVFFRNQEDFDIEAQLKLGKYFGHLHQHATSAVPQREGLEDVLVVWKGDGSQDMRAMFTPSFLWHSDVSVFRACLCFFANLFRSLMNFSHHLTLLFVCLAVHREVEEAILTGPANMPPMMCSRHRCRSIWKV